MLETVQSESLSTLLSAVRGSSDSSPFQTSQFGPIAPGSVLGIHGPSASGKTRLVLDMLLSCVLLRGKAAVLFDLDSTFDPLQFQLLAAKRSTGSSQLQDALRNLHIFRPKSTAQLAVSIAALGRYQRKKVEGDIALVVVDSMSAFHWPDRYTANSSLDHVFTALNAFRLSHRPITVLTNWDLTLADTSPYLDASGLPPASYKQHLSNFPILSESATSDPASLMHLTHDIVLHSPPVAAFHEAASSLSESEVTGYIRKSGSSQVTTFPVEL
ncbi:hypothetical protein C8F01DRAFT_1108345 [Mycena amicta]|nr:hypothetical protein C8F01DRAFT_1108345 [Mycena amicta]